MSLIVGLLCGVTLNIDLIRLISSEPRVKEPFTKSLIEENFSFHLPDNFLGRITSEGSLPRNQLEQ